MERGQRLDGIHGVGRSPGYPRELLEWPTRPPPATGETANRSIFKDTTGPLYCAGSARSARSAKRKTIFAHFGPWRSGHGGPISERGSAGCNAARAKRRHKAQSDATKHKATPQSTKRRHKAALEGHPRNSWRAITSTGKRGFIRVNAPLPQLLHFITSTPRSEGHQFNNQCLDTFSGGTA